MIQLLLLLAVLSFMFFASKHRKRHNNNNNNNNNEPFHPPPGPKGLPFIGNLHQSDPSKPHIYFAKLAEIYGPILSLRLGSKQAVVVQSPKTAKEVLHTQDMNFCYRPSNLGTQKLSYNGLDIVTAYSVDYLREIKKFCVVHLFSAKKVESLAPIRQEEFQRMVSKISSLSLASQTVNLSEVVMSFSISNICRTAFGNRYDDDDDEGAKRSKFHSLLNEAQAIFTTFFFADYLPYLGWLDKLTGQSSRLEKVFKDLDAFYEQIINDHLYPSDKLKSNNQEEDFIDVLLSLRKQGSFAFDLTLDHIKAVLMNIFVAGTDTSAAILVWAMTELVRNPVSMRKVQDELRNLTPKNNKGYITVEDVPKLVYLKSVVKETLRFHPATPLLIVRETLNKCNIQGYDILPKTLMFVNVWAIARDPEYWTYPDIFMPERFMGNNSVDYKGQDFEFIPFGAGRKICPGMLLGISTIEVALANLLYSFNWELPDGIKLEDIDTHTLPGVTMHKKNPLCLVAKKYA